MSENRMPTEAEVAWAAGIFEGEGTAVKSGRSCWIAVEMADRDVVSKLDRIFPAPGGIKRVTRPGKDLYRWVRSSGGDIRNFYEFVFVFLGARRQEQALRVLTALDERPGAKWRKNLTHCKRGHPFSPANTRIVKNGRSCKECERQGKRRRRQANGG